MKRTQVREKKINEEEEKRWDKAEPFEEIKADTELPEEYYHGLEDLPWNLNLLEHLLYISMPAWIQRALLCNLIERFGIWTFHNNILPCRLISYTLLPYTLPASAVISFIYRFLCWVEKIPHQALNAGREFKQEVMAHLWLVFTHLRGLLPNSSPDLAVSPKRQLTSLQMQSHYLQPSSCSST
ncbi:1-acylglycerol-3-phosphate O-acyltransferase PNPLA3-like isoform X2 [Cyprinus carpio]|uniref:1-acylglycerol-3-phosphate O-acyltransferase PNPLA3-like isoform X2 n=1 Tax=Cyprinus carpio TaxID=7962 RepID=A0A9Q9WFG4_CYPCA|nr:1-acylglycerol-3-phosphate O-acyltransferase PNPLA3-like isoform X2 [Cyprinus carpio]